MPSSFLFPRLHPRVPSPLLSPRLHPPKLLKRSRARLSAGNVEIRHLPLYTLHCGILLLSDVPAGRLEAAQLHMQRLTAH
eukprot:5262250-Prymnesium_polylepis.1